jgi:acyl-CoA thioester hydrolase
VSQQETVETRLKVRYAETDQMAVVHHGNYLPWMEMGRLDWCRARGVRYRDLEERDGVQLAVAEVSVRYHTPARFDDEIVVATRLKLAHPRLVRFLYEIRNAETGDLLASGETAHIFVAPGMKPARLPERYFGVFGIRKRE